MYMYVVRKILHECIKLPYNLIFDICSFLKKNDIITKQEIDIVEIPLKARHRKKIIVY